MRPDPQERLDYIHAMVDEYGRRQAKEVMDCAQSLRRTLALANASVAELEQDMAAPDRRSRRIELTGDLSVADVVNAAQGPCDVSGVYFLIKDDELVYVGQSQSVFKRVMTHPVEYDRWAYVACGADERTLVEMLYIRKFQPPMNKAGIELPLEVD